LIYGVCLTFWYRQTLLIIYYCIQWKCSCLYVYWTWSRGTD
jgi:hypothetical protein